jgi:macrolide phosphotransferase
MLSALAGDIVEHGGQPISVEPLPQPAGTAAGADRGQGNGFTVTTIRRDDSAATGAEEAIPAVHVTPIPAVGASPTRDTAPVAAPSDDSLGSAVRSEPDMASEKRSEQDAADDTSTAALKIVDLKTS